MESKAWSDQESDNSDNDESKDTGRSSKHRAPVLPLGTIYQREGVVRPASVDREHERIEPEVAQSIVPGTPEFPLVNPTTQEVPGPSNAIPPYELSRAQPPPTETLDTSAEEADDDDDEGKAKEDAGDTRVNPAAASTPAADTEAQRHAMLDPSVSATLHSAGMPAARQAEALRPTPADIAGAPVTVAPEPNPFEVSAAYPPQYTAPPAERPISGLPQSYEQQVPQPGPYTAGNRPSIQPQSPEGTAFAYSQNQPPEQRWPDAGLSYTAQPRHNTYQNSYTQPANGGDMISKRDFERYQLDSRRKMAGAVLTTLAISWYLNRRKVKPLQEQVQQLQKHNELQQSRITLLENQPAESPVARTIEQPPASLRRPTHEQPQYNPQIPLQPVQRPFETAGVPAGTYAANGVGMPRPANRLQPPTPQQLEKVPRVVGGDGQEIVLGEGQHYERSAGGYGAVLNERNQVVEDAFEYGESYKQDRLPERMPTPFGTQDGRFKDSSGAAPVGGGGGDGSGGVPQATLSSGQVPQDHALSAGQAAGRTTNEEAQYLLEAPKSNPVLSAITSPWLWLAVGVLMIAFFAAATI